MAAVTADWDTQRHFLLGAECSKSLCTSLLASLFFFGRVGECSQCESNSDSCSETESPLGLDLQLINRSLFTPPPAVTRSLSALIRLHNTLMLVSCLSWQTEKLLLRKLSRTLPGKTLQCRKRKKIKKILISASSCAALASASSASSWAIYDSAHWNYTNRLHPRSLSTDRVRLPFAKVKVNIKPALSQSKCPKKFQVL